MARLLCFGDSNTYGFDPRSYLGERYPAPVRWTGLAEQAGWTVLNCGRNGREIPRGAAALEEAEKLAERWPAEVWTVMLGGNDLLNGPGLTAEGVTDRMEAFLSRLLACSGLRETRLLLIAPPPMTSGAWVTEARLRTESARLAGCYQALARRLGVDFADAAGWGVELTFDGVHFTEAGHRAFARGLLAALSAL